MVTLAQIVAFLFPAARPLIDYQIGFNGATGVVVYWNDDLGPQPTPAELSAAELPASKAFCIAANRAECSSRIYARYPVGRQLSASFGLYDSAKVATMVDWIAANVAVENTAADAIEAATTVAEVEAVTVAWPV